MMASDYLDQLAKGDISTVKFIINEFVAINNCSPTYPIIRPDGIPAVIVFNGDNAYELKFAINNRDPYRTVIRPIEYTGEFLTSWDTFRKVFCERTQRLKLSITQYDFLPYPEELKITQEDFYQLLHSELSRLGIYKPYEIDFTGLYISNSKTTAFVELYHPDIGTAKMAVGCPSDVLLIRFVVTDKCYKVNFEEFLLVLRQTEIDDWKKSFLRKLHWEPRI